MKALRILLIVVVVVVVVVGILLALALTPSVQTWAVRKAVAGRPDIKLNVDRVAAGFSSADLAGIVIVKDGLEVTAKHVLAKYSAWDYLIHKRITVDDLTVEGLMIDARAVGAAAPKASPQQARTEQPPPKPQKADENKPFNGILNQIELPADLRIARFSVPGTVKLPNQLSGTFEVHGSDITTGKQGTVDWKADLTSADPNAPARALHTSGTVSLHITTERRIDVLEVNSVAAAEGSNIPPDQLKLQVKAEQPAAGGNEGYNADISVVRAGATERLVSLVGQYNANAHEISGIWNVSVRGEQIAALLSGFGLPDITAEGTGKFAAKPDAGNATANGQLRATVAHPEKISPQLAQVGNLLLQINFDGGMADNALRLEQLAIDATGGNGRKFAQIRTLQRVGFSTTDKRVTFADAKADLARVTIDALPLAWAQAFAQGVTIDSGTASMVLAVAAEPDGSRVRLTSVEPLVLRDVTVRKGNEKLAEQMNLSVKPQAEYTSDHLHAELNDLNVATPAGDNVRGRMTADVTHLGKAPSIAFTTDTKAKFVAMLKPYLPGANTAQAPARTNGATRQAATFDPGPIVVSTKSEGTFAAQKLSFNKSITRVERAAGGLIAAVDMLQPVSFDLQTKAVAAAKPDAEALRVQLGEAPLSWAQAFAPDAVFDGQVAGGTLGVTLRSLDDISARTTQPITVRSASVTMNNQPMVQNVDVSVDFSGGKQGDIVKYDVRRLEARQGQTSLFTLVVAGEAKLGAKPTVVAKGTLDANATALMQQPMLASNAQLSRGTIHATFDANIADTIQAKANVTASDLMAKEGNRELGTAVLDVTAALQPDGSSTVRIPFTLANGTRRSDVTLDGKVSRTGEKINFEGRITSNQLFVDDVMPLASLAPSTPQNAWPAAPATRPVPAGTQTQAPGTAPRATTAAADAKPFWSAANGKVDLDMKQVTYGQNFVVSGIRGGANLAPNQLAVNAEGTMSQNPFKITTTIDFAASQPQPYTLNGAANIPGFDVGAFLRAANPNDKPMLETMVNVDAKLTGHGTSMMDLVKNTYGTFDFNGGKGVLRALGQTKVGQAANVVSSIGAIAGALTGKQEVSAGADLVGIFAELPFDKFTMHAERGADLNLKVTNLEFIGTEVRITGNGVVQNQPNVPVSKQPMQLTLQLAAKGNIAQVLQQRNLISAKPDEQGYYVMSKSFTIGGSASKADSTSLWSILLGAGTDVLRGFLGR